MKISREVKNKKVLAAEVLLFAFLFSNIRNNHRLAKPVYENQRDNKNNGKELIVFIKILCTL